MKRFISHELSKYRLYTPSIEKVEDIFKLKKYTPDHVAFRTFDITGGINIFKGNDKLMEHYNHMDTYRFPEKHVEGTWFKPKNADEALPRLFVSELQCDKLSKRAHKLITRFVNDKHYQLAMINDRQSPIESFMRKEPLNYFDFQIVKQESDYAAWTLLHGNKINHVGISLESINSSISAPIVSLDALNEVLLENGLSVLANNNNKNSSPYVHTSEDKLLEQSSLLADKITITFHGDNSTPKVSTNVSGGFVEFIHRKNGRDGFEANNANRIFESTNKTN